MTTRGRHSGLSREIEIWFTEHEGRFYLSAEYPNSHWVQNIRANPVVQMRVGASRYEAEARVLSPESETVLINAIQNLSREKYGWGEGIVVEIVPLAGIGQL